MREEESSIFLSVVVEKSGHNLPAVRDKFRRIMRAMCGVYPVSKVVGFLAAGLASKNTRSRAECLEELGSVIERHGLDVCERGTRVLPSIVPLCAERDPALRKTALDTLGTAYKVAGEGIWKHLGKVWKGPRGVASNLLFLFNLIALAFLHSPKTIYSPTHNKRMQRR